MMRDLELRGAGNVLERLNTVNIAEIGYELYAEAAHENVNHLLCLVVTVGR